MTAEVIQFPWRWNSGTNTLNSGVIYKKRLGEISNGSKDEEEGTFEEERAGQKQTLFDCPQNFRFRG